MTRPTAEQGRLTRHLRRTFVTGAFTLVPLVVTIATVAWVDSMTTLVSRSIFGRHVPLLGLIVAVVGVYVTGLIAGTLLGRWFIGTADRLLARMPVVSEAYRAWKQVVAGGEGPGIYNAVVWVPTDGGRLRQLGFTAASPGDPGGSGESAARVCVFLPGVPNVLAGRVVLAERADVEWTDLAVEEAFKMLLSGGNYVPRGTLESSVDVCVRPTSTADGLSGTPSVGSPHRPGPPSRV